MQYVHLCSTRSTSSKVLVGLTRWFSSDALVLSAGLHPGLDLVSQVREAGAVLCSWTQQGVAPRVLWRETSPGGCTKADVVRNARFGVLDEGVVASSLGLRSRSRDVLRVYDASLRLGAQWKDYGHLGNTTNRDNFPMQDCMHYCLDTADVLREWVLLLISWLEHTAPKEPSAKQHAARNASHH